MKEFNRLIKKILYPLLEEMGFEKIGTRKSYKYEDGVIYRFQIKAVGSHFSNVTGWPSSSFQCAVEPYYIFLDDSPEKDEDGRVIPPKKWPSQGGLSLSPALDQSHLTHNLSNRAERERKDIWWLEPDEGNVKEVVEDLACQVKRKVPPYLTSAVESAYSENRKFIMPTEESVLAYIESASVEGAKYWLEKLIKFSSHLKYMEDEGAYKKLLSQLVEKKL